MCAYFVRDVAFNWQIHIAKCGATHSYLVVYYPCRGNVDINQLEMYDY